MLGPAFVAAIAYVDPGNFATNFKGGAEFGYLLLWVLVVVNVMAALVQYLSAKVGVVTGLSLPQIIATKLGKKSRIAYWLQGEIVAMGTDVAEVIGGAVALWLLFGLPLVVGGVITAAVSMLLLWIYSSKGQRYFERIIVGMLFIIPAGFFAGIIMNVPDGAQVAAGLVPRLEGQETVLLVVAMIGATIMPHVIYLHSAMARDRYRDSSRQQIGALLKAARVDVGLAMFIAGSINIAMLILAATSLRGVDSTSSFDGIFYALSVSTTPLIAILFAVGLLISGFASTAVGNQAGAVITEGLINRRVPIYTRRLIVLVPAIILLALNVNVVSALIVSQVILSFGIPFALIPLAIITSNRKIMGKATNNFLMRLAIWSITGLITIINIVFIAGVIIQ